MPSAYSLQVAVKGNKVSLPTTPFFQAKQSQLSRPLQILTLMWKTSPWPVTTSPNSWNKGNLTEMGRSHLNQKADGTEKVGRVFFDKIAKVLREYLKKYNTLKILKEKYDICNDTQSLENHILKEKVAQKSEISGNRDSNNHRILFKLKAGKWKTQAHMQNDRS